MIVKSLLAGLALALSTAAVPQAVEPVPIDTVARAKFPHEDGKFVDALAAVNRFVNVNMTYQDDQSHYGKNDYWVMAPSDGKGDCEDYALTKEFLLSEAGFPTVENTKLVLVLVRDDGKIYGHAILAVKMPKGSIAYLDMRSEPMTRRELLARGYQFQNWEA